LSRRRRAPKRSSEEVIDRSRLTTYVEPGGRLLHHFTFRAWNWRDRTLPVRLPRPAKVLAVKAYGRWVSVPARARTDRGTVLGLPVAAGTVIHPFEILYATRAEASTRTPWSRLEAPAPALPVAPVLFRRTWRLPPGVLPLARGGLRRLPGPASDSPFTGLKQLLQGKNSREERAREEQRQRLARAASALTRGGRPRGRLGEALERLAFNLHAERTGLVLDVEALRAAGLNPDSPWHAPSAGAPPWEGWGLVYVPIEAAPLLTTPSAWESWQAASGEAVSRAVLEAVVYGHDCSGRFWSAVNWLRTGPGGPLGDASPKHRTIPASLLPENVNPMAYQEWTAWEPLAGTEKEGELWVVDQGGVSVLGMSLVVVLFLATLLLRGRLSARWRYRLLLVWEGFFGLALFWLPEGLRNLALGPVLAGACLAICWYLWSTASSAWRAPDGEKGRTGEGVKRGSSLSSLLPLSLFPLLLVLIAPGRAAAPAPFPVLLVPGPARAPTKRTALVSPLLLKRLEELARRSPERLSGAVPLSAKYRGKVDGRFARFDADIQVYCFGKTTTLTLPLGDVVLEPRGDFGEPALLQGTKVHPVALPRGQTGYSFALRVKEAGLYRLEIRFSVRVKESGEDRGVRFQVPKLALNQLQLELPAGATGVTEETCLGAQGTSGKQFLVAVGPVGQVRVRWWQPPLLISRAAVKVKEMYLWNLRQPDSSLVGVLHYTISDGAVDHLLLDLPKGVEVRGVEVRRFPPVADNDSVPPLLNKGWQFVKNDPKAEPRKPPFGRRLRVQFHTPVTGQVQMILELVPRLSAGPTALRLSLPTPLQARLLPGLLAYRKGLREVTERDHQNIGVTSIEVNNFARAWRKAVPAAKDPGPPTRAYSFERKQPQGAVLWLGLQPPAVHAAQTVCWRVGRRFADLEAFAVLTCRTASLLLVEWDVPGVTVAEVSGPQVRHWTRTGSRVQVWLKKPCSAAALELRGWLPLPPLVFRSPRGQKRVGFPCLRLLHVTAPETELGFVAEDGLALELALLRNLTPQPARARAGRLAGATLTYSTVLPAYEIALRVRPSRVEVRVQTRAEVRSGEVVFTTRLDYQVTRGDFRHLRLRLRNWPGEKVHVRGQGGLKVEDRGLRTENRAVLDPRSSILDIKVPPRADGRYSLILTARVPVETMTTIPMPDVRDESPGRAWGGIVSQGRWLVVAGNDLAAEESRGLLPVAGSPVRRWKVQRDPWRLRLRPRPRAGPSRVHLLLAEQRAAVVDGRRWLHEGVFWVFVEKGSELRLDLPAGATALATTVNGVGTVGRQPRPDQLWLALPRGKGTQVVRVCWSYPPGLETLTRPNLARPQLPGEVFGGDRVPTLCTILVPDGYRANVRSGRDFPARWASAAGQDLRRAQAQARMSRLLVPQLRGGGKLLAAQLLTAQERFYWYCRQARYGLGLPEREVGDTGPGNQPLEDWRKGLLADNRKFMRESGLDLVRARARKRARGSYHLPSSGPAGEEIRAATMPALQLPSAGTLTAWVVDDPRKPLRLHLSSERAWQDRRLLAASGLLLAGLLLAWLLSSLPRLVAALQTTWPEQLVLLGWLVWRTPNLRDFPLAALVLMGLGGGARLFLVGRWLVGLFLRTKPAQT
jgi:hypothetical protein